MAKIKIGDKVQVTKLDTNWYAYVPSMKDYLGKTGMVTMVYNSHENVMVQFDDEDDGTMEWALPIDWVKLIEKAPKYWTGKIVVISSSDRCYGGRNPYFTVGKIYNVKDGLIQDNTHTPFNQIINKKRSFQEVHDYLAMNGVDILEFKGYAEED